MDWSSMTDDPVDALSAKTVAYTSVFASIATEIAQAKQAKIRAQMVGDRHATTTLRREQAGVTPAQRPVPADRERPRATVSHPIADRQIVETAPPTQHPATRAQLLAMHRDAEFFYRQARPDSWVPEYMRSRGLGEMLHDDCPWRVGYAPGGPRVWTALTDDLHGRGWSDEQIIEAGLGTKSVRGNVVDRFHDRMVISARNAQGETVGFVGRRAPDCTNEKSPKYLNSPETPIYRKGEVLLGVAEERELLNAGATPVIVEGALDAYAVTTATDGRYVGVAPSGTALTVDQADLLWRVSGTPSGTTYAQPPDVIVGMDADKAGEWAMNRAYQLLQPNVETVRAALWPTGQDPAGMWAAGDRDGIASRLEHPGPLADVVIDSKLDGWLDRSPGVEGRVNAARDVAMTVVDLPVDQIGRQVAHVAKRLDLETSTVTSIVTDTIGERDRPPANRGLDVSRESVASL
jgi:DNA primase catalytic core